MDKVSAMMAQSLAHGGIGFQAGAQGRQRSDKPGVLGSRGYIYVKVHHDHDERLVVAGAVIYYDC